MASAHMRLRSYQQPREIYSFSDNLSDTPDKLQSKCRRRPVRLQHWFDECLSQPNDAGDKMSSQSRFGRSGRDIINCMSSMAWLIFLVFLLTVAGSLTLVFITVKYYWGERGTPPLTGEARRQQRERELRQRARQIELSRKNPRPLRGPSFWDNTKNGSK